MFTTTDIPQIPGLWAPIAHTPHYQCLIDGVAYIARYVKTVRGHGSYMVHRAWNTESKCKPSNALCVGGLPSAHVLRNAVHEAYAFGHTLP